MFTIKTDAILISLRLWSVSAVYTVASLILIWNKKNKIFCNVYDISFYV